VRLHPVLEDEKPGSGRERDILTHMEMSEYEIINMPVPGKIHGKLVQRLVGPSENIFPTLRHTAFL